MAVEFVARALSAHLNTLTIADETFDIAWPGQKFNPDPAKIYLMPTLAQSGSVPIAFSPVCTRAKYLYSVRCVIPERRGDLAAYKVSDAVSTHFFPTTGEPQQYVSGGVTVNIAERPTIEPLQRGEGFRAVTVNIIAIVYY